jgi:hypothetical protein
MAFSSGERIATEDIDARQFCNFFEKFFYFHDLIYMELIYIKFSIFRLSQNFLKIINPCYFAGQGKKGTTPWRTSLAAREAGHDQFSRMPRRALSSHSTGRWRC